MSERKKQFSCTPDDETVSWMADLKPRIAAALGLPKVSDPVLLRLAMMELRKKYPPSAEEKKPKK